MGADGELGGRVAVVTGGGAGIGRAVARRLVDAGARVAITGRDRGRLDEAASELGGGTLAVPCDVSDPAAVEHLHDRVREWAWPVTILVNNAGVAGPTAALVDVDPADWDEVMAINVRGVYLCCRAFLPGMVERGDGDVINLSSVSGKRPLARRTPYTASKMAVIGLTRTLAFEVGPLGVRVNTLSPGPVRGPRMDGVFEREAQATGTSIEDAERAYVSRAAMSRMVTEDEVAEAVVAMLRMRSMSGADIDLSAGMVA
ncbi:MAG TPA: SDR family oxidoreductase [Baekduia sp.]|nr:SDR family oxidoreductase [Baekduia sp.]